MPEQIPVTLGRDACWGQDICGEEAFGLMAILLQHDFRDLKHIEEKLKVDTKNRKRDNNLINFADDKPKHIRDRRQINKALSMELLTSLLLTHLDAPERVTSHCVEKNGRPNNFAASGQPDITAHYPASGQGKAFELLAEVSVKRNPSQGFFLLQLQQAYDHARALSEENGGLPIYALVINDCEVSKDPSLQSAYKTFLFENGIKSGDNLQVLPLSAIDFTCIMDKIIGNQDNVYEALSSEALAKAWEGLIDDLRQENVPIESDWMIDRCLEIFKECHQAQDNLGFSPIH